MHPVALYRVSADVKVDPPRGICDNAIRRLSGIDILYHVVEEPPFPDHRSSPVDFNDGIHLGSGVIMGGITACVEALLCCKILVGNKHER